MFVHWGQNNLDINLNFLFKNTEKLLFRGIHICEYEISKKYNQIDTKLLYS